MAKIPFEANLDVKWIVTEGNNEEICADGEFGVSINGIPFLYYKWPNPDPSSADVHFRPITKREFGETLMRGGHIYTPLNKLRICVRCGMREDPAVRKSCAERLHELLNDERLLVAKIRAEVRNELKRLRDQIANSQE